MLNPLPNDRWNYETAAHLLNRAGFGGPPAEIQKLADSGPDKAVSSLIDYEHIRGLLPDPDWATPDPQRLENLRLAIKNAKPEDAQMLKQQENRLQAARLLELRGWWFERMAKGPRP